MDVDQVAKLQKNNSNKKRFSEEQVKSLESIFSSESRPGSRRKKQIADQLGLHPCQVSVWFQNRRARTKSKQTERDYNILKACYDSLATKFENLKNETQSLIIEVQRLRDLKERPKDSTSDTAPATFSSNGESLFLSSPKKHIVQPNDHFWDKNLHRDVYDGLKSFEQETESQIFFNMIGSADGSLASSRNHNNLEATYLMEHNCISDWWEFWT